MHAPRRDRQPSISLFPMLSILSCVSGTLTLLIVGLSLGDLSPVSAGADRAAARELYVSLTGGSEALRGRLSGLERLVAEAVALGGRLERACAERERLEREAEQADAREELHALDAARLAELREREQSALEELDRLSGQLAGDEDELAGLERGAQESAGAYRIDRGSFATTGLVPSFVECTSAGLTLGLEAWDPQADPRAESLVRVPLAEIGTSASLVQYLERAAALPDSTVIFLVRPGGVFAYDAAFPVLEGRVPRHGKMPVPGTRPVDLGAFRTAPTRP